MCVYGALWCIGVQFRVFFFFALCSMFLVISSGLQDEVDTEDKSLNEFCSCRTSFTDINKGPSILNDLR